MSDTGLTNRLRQRSRRAGLAVGLSMALTLGLGLGGFIVLYARLEPLTRDFVGVQADAPAGAASRYARITVRAVECPSDDPVGWCDGDLLPGIAFQVAGSWRTSDEAGEASWAPGAGAHRIITEQPPPAAGFYVSCADQVDGDLLFAGIAADQTAVQITTTGGQPVVCDWYLHAQPSGT